MTSPTSSSSATTKMHYALVLCLSLAILLVFMWQSPGTTTKTKKGTEISSGKNQQQSKQNAASSSPSVSSSPSSSPPSSAAPVETQPAAATSSSPPSSSPEDTTDDNDNSANSADNKNKKKKRKFVMISFVDNSGSHNSVGVMYGALSRMCYARMHGYHSVTYSDKDLAGWVPQTAQRAHRGYPSEGNRQRMWSKNFVMRRCFEEFNMTDNDICFWTDADVIVTNPEVKLEYIVQKASEMRDPKDGSRVVHEPDMIVSNTINGINNGVYAMRATEWSKKFLTDWWEDQNSNQHAADNGPFMHSVLKAMADSHGLKYKDECHMNTNHAYATFHPFAACMVKYLHDKLCHGKSEKCVSRCQQYSLPEGSPWEAGRRQGRDWQHGYITAYDKHIGGFCKMNSCSGWGFAAEWQESDLFFHMAGRGQADRNQTMQQLAMRMKNKFKPRCW